MFRAPPPPPPTNARRVSCYAVSNNNLYLYTPVNARRRKINRVVLRLTKCGRSRRRCTVVVSRSHGGTTSCILVSTGGYGSCQYRCCITYSFTDISDSRSIIRASKHGRVETTPPSTLHAGCLHTKSTSWWVLRTTSPCDVEVFAFVHDLTTLHEVAASTCKQRLPSSNIYLFITHTLFSLFASRPNFAAPDAYITSLGSTSRHGFIIIRTLFCFFLQVPVVLVPPPGTGGSIAVPSTIRVQYCIPQ